MGLTCQQAHVVRFTLTYIYNTDMKYTEKMNKKILKAKRRVLKFYIAVPSQTEKLIQRCGLKVSVKEGSQKNNNNKIKKKQ